MRLTVAASRATAAKAMLNRVVMPHESHRERRLTAYASWARIDRHARFALQSVRRNLGRSGCHLISAPAGTPGEYADWVAVYMCGIEHRCCAAANNRWTLWAGEQMSGWRPVEQSLTAGYRVVPSIPERIHGRELLSDASTSAHHRRHCDHRAAGTAGVAVLPRCIAVAPTADPLRPGIRPHG